VRFILSFRIFFFFFFINLITLDHSYTSLQGGSSSTPGTTSSSSSATCHKTSKIVTIVVPAVLGAVIGGLLILLAFLLIRRRRAAKDVHDILPPVISTGMRSQQSIIAPFPTYPQNREITRDGHSRLPSDGESLPGSEGDSLIPSDNFSRNQGNVNEIAVHPALPLHPVPFTPASPITFGSQDIREASIPEMIRTGTRSITHSGPRHPSLHSMISPVTPSTNYPPFDLSQLTRPNAPDERSRSMDSGPQATLDSSEGTNQVASLPGHLVESPMDSGMLPVAVAIDDDARRFSSPPPEYTPS
jgi:hypothetical protein